MPPSQQGGNLVYAPVWYCIYCSDGIVKEATKRNLGKEHIIPFGLGGNLILPRSSCKKCGRETGMVDTTCQHMFLGPARIRLNLPTRHPSERPTKLTMVWRHADGREEKETVAAHDYPLTIPCLDLPPPGILTGTPPHEYYVTFRAIFPNDEVKKKLQQDGPALRIATFNNHTFCRMLAKIAHSFAVAEWGYNNFTHFLPDLILGRNETASEWIGGSQKPPQPDPNGLHRIFALRERIRNVEYVIVYLTLFSLFGGSEYRIVVGEWKGPSN